MNWCRIFSISLIFCGLCNFKAEAFQLYTRKGYFNGPMSPEIKDFVFYISSTYHSFQTKTQTKTTEVQYAQIRHALSILEQESGVGLKFYFGGYFDALSMKNNLRDASNAMFDKRIYFDLTGSDWTGEATATTSEHAGASQASGILSKLPYYTGGAEFTNSKLFDLNHPRTNLTSVYLHEVLHIIGLDHSTAVDSRMSYNNPTWEGISEDDRLGLYQIYGGPFRNEISVTATLDGIEAPGTEIVFVNTLTGKSTITFTSYTSAVAHFKSLEPGTYWVVGREMTPTGPCFIDPTRGFLTSFYVNDSSSTNIPNNAAKIEVTNDSVLNIKLNLIKGVKRFDCYQAFPTADSRIENVKDKFNSFTAKPSAYVIGTLYTDKNTLDKIHVTSTNVNSGLHSSIHVSSIGENPGIDVLSSVWGKPQAAWDTTNWPDATILELSVSETAKPGTYSALCEAGGEYALSAAIYNVRDDVTEGLNYGELFPELKYMMTDENFPANQFEIARGEYTGGFKSSSKPKSLPLGIACGQLVGQNSSLTSVIMLVLASVIPFFTRKKKNEKN